MAIHKNPKKRKKRKSRKVIGAGTVINRGRGTGPRKKSSPKEKAKVANNDKKKKSSSRPKFMVSTRKSRSQINKF